ncbi:MAG: single-stranded DNA-binding protein [Hyphomicrobiales bacterium]|nr:single-stranded DNA-binding protein [Hyphomicrobiales bacterium]
MHNRAQLIGNLGKDPEIRATRDGREIASFSLATSESWRDRETGEKRERVEWHQVVVFSEGLVKVVKGYLKKGMRVLVEGKIATRKWQDNEGRDRWSTEIVLQGYDAKLLMLEKPNGGGRPAADSADDYGSGDDYGGRERGRPADDLNDEIPF